MYAQAGIAAARRALSRCRPAFVCGLAASLALCTAACVSAEDAWSFRLTRDIYSDIETSGPVSAEERHREHLAGTSSNPSASGEATVYLVIAAIPVVVDVVILPVTGAHDLLLPIVRLVAGDGDAPAEGPLRPAPPPPR